MDAKKDPVGPDELPGWLRGKKKIIVARGKKFAEHNAKGLKTESRIELVLGPSGKLRAPTFVIGDTMLVGFNEEMYAENGL